jgi:hypothetical protein
MARHDQPVRVRRKRQAALLGVAEAEAAGVADGAHRQDELVDLQQSGAGPTGRGWGKRWYSTLRLSEANNCAQVRAGVVCVCVGVRACVCSCVWVDECVCARRVCVCASLSHAFGVGGHTAERAVLMPIRSQLCAPVLSGVTIWAPQ